MFDRFRKKKEGSEDAGFGMVEERPGFNQDYSVEAFSSDARESINEEKLTEKVDNNTPVETQPQKNSSVSLTSEIGISALMDKRTRLDEAIDYVGLMIKNLKDKRTRLEKDIEQESVDIKNLKEKLMKVSDYIEEENQGIQNLKMKRTAVEKEADEVGNFISNLRNRLSGIDRVIDDEGNKIKSFKESRPKQE
ncbi:MAG: transcriptional regulator [Thermoproteota archaeon]